MKKGQTKPVVIVALLGNVAVSLVKFAAFFFTSSSAMLSEAIHSLVDCGNELLLLLGISRSKKPADEAHPFGHGKELYFWALMVANLVFILGGVLSIYQGVIRLLNPRPIQHVLWAYSVLAASFLFEGSVWLFSVHRFRREKGPRGWVEGIRRSKDPALFCVLLEDSAALLGLVLAAVGTFLSHQFHFYYGDGLASVAIGIVLGLVAFELGAETKALLIGESADPKIVGSIQELVRNDSAVEAARRPLTMHFGPDQVLLNLDVQFRPGLSAQEIERAVDRLEGGIRARHPEIKNIFLEAESISARRRPS